MIAAGRIDLSSCRLRQASTAMPVCRAEEEPAMIVLPAAVLFSYGNVRLRHQADAAAARRTGSTSCHANLRPRQQLLRAADGTDAPRALPHLDLVSARESFGLIERLGIGRRDEINSEGGEARLAEERIGAIVRH